MVHYTTTKVPNTNSINTNRPLLLKLMTNVKLKLKTFKYGFLSTQPWNKVIDLDSLVICRYYQLIDQN